VTDVYVRYLAIEISYVIVCCGRLYFSNRPANVRDGSVRSNKRTSLSSTRGGAQPASSSPGHGANGPPSRTSPRNSDNSVHPGPIFLRHVVSRPFEYRWLILATTVITCMTIIVIVSVVYSNLWITVPPVSRIFASLWVSHSQLLYRYLGTDILAEGHFFFGVGPWHLSSNIYIYIYILTFCSLFVHHFFKNSTAANTKLHRSGKIWRQRNKARSNQWTTTLLVALFRNCW